MPDADHQYAQADHDLVQDDIGMQAQARTGTSEENHNIRPVTLRQVLDAKQECPGDKKTPWLLYGQRINYITVVATVIKETVKEDECRAWYSVIDGTSNKAVTVFRHFERSIDRFLPADGSHRYVSIIGHLGASSGNYGNSITANAINAVDDPHEVFYHALNVFYTELRLEKGPPPKEVLDGLPDEVKNIADTGKSDDLPATQDVSFANSLPPTPVRPVRPAQPSASTVREVRPPTNLSYTPTRPTKPPQTPKKPTVRPATPTRPATPPRVSPARRHAEEPAGPASPTKYFALEPESPSAGPITPRRAPAPSPPSPPVSPSPSPERPGDKGKGRATIKPDPLSHLGALQRTILLCIMENQTETSDVHIGDIGDCVFSENLGIDKEDIGHALDSLKYAGYIETVGEPIDCFYRALEQDDGYMGYGSIYD